MIKKFVMLLLCACFLLASCASEPLDEKGLRVLFSEKNHEDVLYWCCDDFDMDGEMEAFAITGYREEYDAVGDTRGSVWYISRSEYRQLSSSEEGTVLRNPAIINHGDVKHFVINHSPIYPPSSYAFIWQVKEGVPNVVYENFRAVFYDDDALMSVFTIFDTQRRWTHYRLYWNADTNEYDETFVKEEP